MSGERRGFVLQSLLLVYILSTTYDPRSNTGIAFHTQDPNEHAGATNVCVNIGNVSTQGHFIRAYNGNGPHRGSDPRSYTKYGTFMQQVFNISLIHCGDIEINPGPVQHVSRKYKLKFPCIVCEKRCQQR